LDLRHEGFPKTTLDLKTSFKRNMSGLLRGFVKRPAAIRHQFTIRCLGRTDTTCVAGIEVGRDTVITFLKAASGKVITYTYESVSKKCRILNYGQFQFDGRNSYTLNIELEEVIA
jgi:hypothetical protein